MKRLAHLNAGIMIAVAITLYLAYYLLLQDSFLHISISDIINNAHQLEAQKHLLILGLLPVYIGTIVFGSAVLGAWVGSWLQQLILNKHKKNPLQYKILSKQ